MSGIETRTVEQRLNDLEECARQSQTFAIEITCQMAGVFTALTWLAEQAGADIVAFKRGVDRAIDEARRDMADGLEAQLRERRNRN